MDRDLVHSVVCSRSKDHGAAWGNTWRGGKAVYTGTPPVVLEPTHTLTTNYTYNSLNAVRVQQSPDGGIDKHWYDRLGRPVISQSARQQAASPKLYSYMIYDYKGRITEAGEISSDSLPVTTGGGFIEQTDADAFIAGAVTRAQVTRSYYNSSPFSATMDTLFRPFGQENLRNRIAVMTYTETYGVDTAYDFATHYSYDVLGNVKTLMQDIKELASRNNRYKRIDYEYDLQSGKVNRVIYQKDSVDQYMYVYEYDADNRLSETTSGPNEMFMKTESVQSYYDHGPLFRTQLGEDRVQGIDYAYTLQGWIKGVNGSGLNAAKDIGRDGYISGGNTNQPVARDAFGFTLNYYNGIYDGGTALYHDGDYTPVTPATATFAAAVTGTGGAFDTHGKDLFNGNIRYTTLQLKGIDTVPIAYAYRYDQLHRLKEMNFFNASINASTYSLNNSTAASGDYHEAYSYDGNGNILTLNRRGYYSGSQAQAMDSLTYAYTSGTNRLSQLSDIINVANYSVDLDSVNNYTYDESGNLKTDAKERISGVTWSPYGKIKNIAKNLDTVNIAYSYDASMNRVMKKYTTASDTVKTYYIRDGLGNVLAVYTIDNDSLRWTEQHLFGSTRLGLIEKNILLNSSTINVNKPGTPGLVLGIKRNERRYELTNHLGNVLSVISDVKRPKTESSNTYYDVDRIAVNDYYPFGMQMPGRKVSLDVYRFGFNGKENDNEVKGEGNQQDYGMRIYDPRVGRFLSRDPLARSYPWNSTYAFAENDVIRSVDLDGGEKKLVFIYYNKEKQISSIRLVRFRDVASGELQDMKLRDSHGNLVAKDSDYYIIYRDENNKTFKKEARSEVDPLINEIEKKEYVTKVLKQKFKNTPEFLGDDNLRGEEFKNPTEHITNEAITKSSLSLLMYDNQPVNSESNKKGLRVIVSSARSGWAGFYNILNTDRNAEINTAIESIMQGGKTIYRTNLEIDHTQEYKKEKVNSLGISPIEIK